MSKDDWRTPKWLFDWCESRYGEFVLDAAADDTNHLCEEYLTKETNALEFPWHQVGTNVFCNPPYSNILPWLEFATNELVLGVSSTFILPPPNGTKWAYYLNYASELVHIIGRVGFIHPDTGLVVNQNRQGTLIARFDADKPYKRTYIEFVYRDDMR